MFDPKRIIYQDFMDDLSLWFDHSSRSDRIANHEQTQDHRKQTHLCYDFFIDLFALFPSGVQ